MDRSDFIKHLRNQNPLLLDGATGTNLQAAGLPKGQSPERWVLDNPEILQNLQRQFYEAGSDVVYAFSFGANRIKLLRHGFAVQDTEEINEQLARISCAVRDEAILKSNRPLWVAGDLAPTGEFLKPAGRLDLPELIDIYRQQVRGLLRAGVDLFVAETMLDLAQTRAAVLAVRAECDLPVLASLTVEQNGRTLSGNSLLECIVTLKACGADAVGLNCSFGPDGLGKIVRDVIAQSPVPLLIKPNAGLPRWVDGQTVFDMSPDVFAQAMADLVEAGVLLAGGCCGTRPDHIQALNQELAQRQLRQTGQPEVGQNPREKRMAQIELANEHFEQMICSARQTVDWQNLSEWPTLAASDPDNFQDDLLDLSEDDPPVIAVNLEAISEFDLPVWLDTLDLIQMTNPVPLVFQGSNPTVLQAFVRQYAGRAGVILKAGQTFSFSEPIQPAIRREG